MKSRWSGRPKKLVSDLYFSVFKCYRFLRICACCSFSSMKCARFVDEIMVLGDYISEYPLDGDEKQVVREALKSSFHPVLQRFRMMQILRNMRLLQFFVDGMRQVSCFC